MAEKRLFRACMYIIVAMAMVAIASFSAYSADDLPFDESYYDNFKEGKSMVVTLSELDLLTFTFYDTNYTSRLMSIHSHSIDIRVGMKGREIEMGALIRFDIDDEDGYDLNVTLTDISEEDVATLRFSLEEKPEPEPEPDDNITNTTNSTSDTNSTNTTDTGNTNSSDDGNSSQDSNSDDSNDDHSTETDSSDEGGEEDDENKVTGGTVVINFNITLSEGGIVGLLIIVAIVLIGMATYLKVKKKSETTGKRRTKQGKSMKPVKRKPFLKTTYRNMKPRLKKMRKGFNTARVKVAEVIGGGKIIKEEIHMPPKSPKLPKNPKLHKRPKN